MEKKFHQLGTEAILLDEVIHDMQLTGAHRLVWARIIADVVNENIGCMDVQLQQTELLMVLLQLVAQNTSSQGCLNIVQVSS